MGQSKDKLTQARPPRKSTNSTPCPPSSRLSSSTPSGTTPPLSQSETESTRSSPLSRSIVDALLQLLFKMDTQLESVREPIQHLAEFTLKGANTMVLGPETRQPSYVRYRAGSLAEEEYKIGESLKASRPEYLSLQQRISEEQEEAMMKVWSRSVAFVRNGSVERPPEFTEQQEQKDQNKEMFEANCRITITPPPVEYKDLDDKILTQPLLMASGHGSSHNLLELPAEVPLEQISTIINLRKPKRNSQKEEERGKKRRDLLKEIQKRRAQVALESPVSYSRDLMLKRVARIIFAHIREGEEVRVVPSEAALLFREADFATVRWSIKQANGLQSTAPTLIYHLQRISGQGMPPEGQEEVYVYIWEIFQKMRLALECSIICLIYVERLMSCAQLELRALNWRPIVYVAVLLASKFWEDINFWNIDYAQRFPSRFPLHSINELENRFFALCQYNLFISFPYYLKYYFAINAASHPLLPRDTEASDPNWSEINQPLDRPSSLGPSLGNNSLAPSLPNMH